MTNKQRIDRQLAVELQAIVAGFDVDYSYVTTYCTTGGKGVRPLLFLESVEAWGGVITDMEVRVAVAIELIHIFFIIHDDIMDDDDLRRNQPTVHHYFSKKYGVVQGRAIAIVFGDAIYNHAINILHTYTQKQNVDLLAQTLDVVATTARGQIQELHLTSIPTVEEVLEFYTKKTAMYSIYYPLALAALVTGRDGQLESLRQFSQHLGIAYQVYDDVIEVLGQKKRSLDGRVGDVSRLKVTPLLLRVFDFLTVEVKEDLQGRMMRGEGVSLEEENLLLHHIIEKGVLSEVIDIVVQEVRKAEAMRGMLQLENIALITSICTKYLKLKDEL